MDERESRNDERVFVVDAIDARPGEAGKVREAYLSEYAPGARARGMTLLHAWLSPPLESDRIGQRLTFVWSVPDVEGWWSMRTAASFDPSVERFWRRLEPSIEGRERRFHQQASRGA